MEKLEYNFLMLIKLDPKKLERMYVMIEMEGKPFRVRVITYGDEAKKDKKTLVMTHGFLGCSLNWVWMFKPLAERYRLVLFDHSSWGLNTRLDQSVGMESEEAAENW